MITDGLKRRDQARTRFLAAYKEKNGKNFDEALPDAATWAELETALNGTVLRVYAVDGDRVRLDSTSAKTYAGVSEGGAVSVRA